MEISAGTQGGAVWGSSKVAFEISNTKLNNNHASLFGGAIFITMDIQLLVTNCTVEGNSAGPGGLAGGLGGAVAGFSNVTLQINNSKINSNHAALNGGAICVTSNVKLLVTNCTLDGNSAGMIGGAITGQDVKLRIDKSNFKRNAILDLTDASGADVFILGKASLEVRYTFIL